MSEPAVFMNLFGQPLMVSLWIKHINVKRVERVVVA